MKVTRSGWLSHQLVRHRAGVAFDQQSQRYLNYKRPSYMVPGSLVDAPPVGVGGLDLVVADDKLPAADKQAYTVLIGMRSWLFAPFRALLRVPG